MEVKEKPKRDPVTAEMRERLLSNCNGRLTTQQYKDVILAPLVSLLVLITPLIVVLGWRFAFASGLWIMLLVGVFALGIPLLLRARRYARAPVHFAIFNSGDDHRPTWLFWRPQLLYTQAGESMRFSNRLAPYMPLRKNSDYLVYYLVDPGSNVLLSIAPADHPDAQKWQPTGVFQTRFQQRTRA